MNNDTIFAVAVVVFVLAFQLLYFRRLAADRAHRLAEKGEAEARKAYIETYKVPHTREHHAVVVNAPMADFIERNRPDTLELIKLLATARMRFISRRPEEAFLAPDDEE